MDRLELMKRRSVSAALLCALLIAGIKTPAAAVLALAAGHIVCSGLAWVTAQSLRPAWAWGTRGGNEARKWMRASLCGALCGGCVLMGGWAIWSVRFSLHAPILTALCACFAARSCTLFAFMRRQTHAFAPVAGSAAAFLCVSVCLYPLF